MNRGILPMPARSPLPYPITSYPLPPHTPFPRDVRYGPPTLPLQASKSKLIFQWKNGVSEEEELLSYYKLSNVCLSFCLSVCSLTPLSSLGLRSPNLVGECQMTQEYSIMGSFRTRLLRSKVSFFRVLRSIRMKLRGRM